MRSSRLGLLSGRSSRFMRLKVAMRSLMGILSLLTVSLVLAGLIIFAVMLRRAFILAVVSFSSLRLGFPA